MKLAVLLLLAVPAWAQLPPGAAPSASPPAMLVVARDSAGREARGLEAADFEVIQAGTPLPVAEAVFTGAEAPRTFVLVVDDYNLPDDCLEKVRAAVDGFGGKIRAGDLVSLLRTRSGSGTLQQLSADRALLKLAAEQIRAGVQARRSPAERYAVATAGTLRLALAAARTIPGRKIVVLFSCLFRTTDLTQAEALTRAAQAAGAVVYVAGMGPADGDAKPLGESEPEAVARATGGKVLDGANPVAALDQVLEDLCGYYRLSLESGTLIFDIATGGRLLDGLTVRVKKPGIIVTAPGAAVASGEQDPSTPGEELGRALASPFQTAPLSVRTAPVVGRNERDGTYVESASVLDLAELSSVRRVNGDAQVVMEVAAETFGKAGASGHGASRVLRATVRPDAFGEPIVLPPIGLPKHPEGLYLMRFLVRDETNGRVGQTSAIVEVPAFSGRLAIAGLTLGRPARETGPSQGDIAAVRVFAAGGSLVYACSLINVAATPENRSQIETTMKVYRYGQLIANATPTVIQFEPSGNPRQRVASGTLNLGPQVAAGEYTLEMTAVDRLAPGNPSVVALQTFTVVR